ncbi:hypothetical protein FRC06_005330, partial [Ceratobasidium sp. 370]
MARTKMTARKSTGGRLPRPVVRTVTVGASTSGTSGENAGKAGKAGKKAVAKAA